MMSLIIVYSHSNDTLHVYQSPKIFLCELINCSGVTKECICICIFVQNISLNQQWDKQ